MTMQNPNKPILAKDLNDYHNKILPYLGGMPEVLANKFAKGDLYDTNEKIIGCWIDRKPLYQKVVTGLSITTSAINWSSEIAVSTNIETLVNVIGLYDNTKFYSFNEAEKTTNGIQIIGNQSDNRTITTIIVQYTKTTDQANSFIFGNTTDYSTEEKIIGTWIDGSYIYQKTINCGTMPNKQVKQIPHDISNLSEVIYISGTMKNLNSIEWLTLPNVVDRSGNVSMQCSVFVNDTYIELSCRDHDISTYTGIITIQYTKTT